MLSRCKHMCTNARTHIHKCACERAHAQVAKLQKDIALGSEQLESLAKERDAIQDTLNTLKLEHAHSLRTMSELTSKLEKQESEMNALKKKLAELQQELDATKKALDQDESELKQDRELLIKDKQALASKDAEIEGASQLQRSFALAGT